jgi:type I restriction enzyme, S subunit
MNNRHNIRLGELVEIKHGWPFKSDLCSDVLTGRPIVVNTGNFRYTGGFRFEETKIREYRGEYPLEYELPPGAILVIMTCQTPNGEILGVPARVPKDGKIYLHNQRLGRVVLKGSHMADYSYLYWIFLSPDFNHELFLSASGTKILHTAPSRIEAVQIKLPPLSEQQAIAAVFDALDDKIELNRRMNETLEAIARALFRDWFVDFGPTYSKLEGRQPYLAPDLWSLFPDVIDNEEKPLGWSVLPLDEMADFLNGLALQKFPGTGHGDLPVIKIAELRAGVTANSDWASNAVPKDYIVDDGDILFAWSGSLIQRIWTGGRGALNQHLFKVSSTRFPKWLHYFWVDHHLRDFQAIAASKATTMGHIQRHHLSEAETVIGDEPVMKAADALIAPLFERLITNDLESRTLAQTRDLLLPKLLSGEIRVKDAEKFLAEVA